MDIQKLMKLADYFAKCSEKSAFNIKTATAGVPFLHLIFLDPLTDRVHVFVDNMAKQADVNSCERRLNKAGFKYVTGSPVDCVALDDAPWLCIKNAASYDTNLTLYSPAQLKHWENPVKVATYLASGKLSFISANPFTSDDIFAANVALASMLQKDAFAPLGSSMDLNGKNMPSIDRDSFGNLIWQDPQVPWAMRMATLGLAQNAAIVAQDRPFITPYDFARASVNPQRGFQVGQTLAAMASLHPDSQQQLMNSGAWSRLLTAVVPNAYEPDFYVYHL